MFLGKRKKRSATTQSVSPKSVIFMMNVAGSLFSVDTGEQNVYSGNAFEHCPSPSDLFCQLSGTPDWVQVIVCMTVLGVYITVVAYAYNLTDAAYETQVVAKKIEKEGLEKLEQKMAHKPEDLDHIMNAVRRKVAQMNNNT